MGRNVDLRGQVSVVMGLWLVVVAAFISRRGVENRPQQEQQHLEIVGEKDQQPLELVGETSSDMELRYQPSDYLNPHNNARRSARANIPNLRWSGTLANYARNWAETLARDRCVAQYSGGPYGENIYRSRRQSTPPDAVDNWVSEKQWYNYNSNSCDDDQFCGHYTQVVWKNTRSLGCASVTCPGMDGGSLVVCSYDPPGNWAGHKPY